MTAIRFTTGAGWKNAPIDPSRIIEGAPITEMNPLSSQGSLSTGFWQCTAGRFTWHYSVNESIYIIAGSVRIRDTREGTWHHLFGGDSVLFTKGSSAEWVVEHFVRKFYVIDQHRSLIARVRDKILGIVRFAFWKSA